MWLSCTCVGESVNPFGESVNPPGIDGRLQTAPDNLPVVAWIHKCSVNVTTFYGFSAWNDPSLGFEWNQTRPHARSTVGPGLLTKLELWWLCDRIPRDLNLDLTTWIISDVDFMTRNTPDVLLSPHHYNEVEMSARSPLGTKAPSSIVSPKRISSQFNRQYTVSLLDFFRMEFWFQRGFEDGTWKTDRQRKLAID